MNLDATRHALHLRGFDPDQLALLLSGGRLEHFLLTGAKCDVDHHRWTCGDLSLDSGHYSFPVRIMGDFSDTRLCIGYMRTLSAPTWVNGYEADLGTIEFYPAGSELNYRAGADGEWVAIGLTEATLQEAALRRLGHGLTLPKAGVTSVPIPEFARRALDRGVRRLMARSRVHPEMIEGFVGYLAELLDHLRQNDMEALIRKSAYRDQLIGRANAFLRHHGAQPFNARALATAVGATERSLQRHFIAACGMTPHEWARCLGLHRARERLRHAHAKRFTVEGIAAECGFRHMGRFANYYRELFGELPSAALSPAGRDHRQRGGALPSQSIHPFLPPPPEQVIWDDSTTRRTG